MSNIDQAEKAEIKRQLRELNSHARRTKAELKSCDKDERTDYKNAQFAIRKISRELAALRRSTNRRRKEIIKRAGLIDRRKSILEGRLS
jgi:hypothetical protein